MKKQHQTFKKYCKYQHNTEILGRDHNGKCSECRRIYMRLRKRKDPTKDSRIKLICKNGHNVTILGRTKNRKCRKCDRIQQKQSRINDPLKHKKAKIRWRLKHPRKYKEMIIKQNLKRYGITKRDGTPFSLCDLKLALKMQAEKCKICGIHSSKLSKSLNVDHDHKTKIFRGLLCTQCNQALGLFKDDIEVIKNAVNYLKNV